MYMYKSNVYVMALVHTVSYNVQPWSSTKCCQVSLRVEKKADIFEKQMAVKETNGSQGSSQATLWLGPVNNCHCKRKAHMS